MASSPQHILVEACSSVMGSVVQDIERRVEDRQWIGDLGSLILEYPLRPAKGLRPTLCVSTAQALGAHPREAERSAVALELLHNAFLIHDDVEDASEIRRGRPTLHREYGVPAAVNVADGMFAMCLEPLLENCEAVGVGSALRILSMFADTVQVTVDGQALELAWIRENRWFFEDFEAEYVDLVQRKTAHYSFLAPVEIGAICAGAEDATLSALRRYSSAIGVAFQIADDLLNVIGNQARVGKEANGDLWEGKRTLMLMHALQSAGQDRGWMLEILGKPRPVAADPVLEALQDLESRGDVPSGTSERVRAELGRKAPKSASEVDRLRRALDDHGSIDYARAVATRYADRGLRALEEIDDVLERGAPRDLLHAMPAYVVNRIR